MTYPSTATYWLEATDRVAVGLRRYASSQGGIVCELGGYHSALVFTGEDDAVFDEANGRRALAVQSPDAVVVDSRWPTRCRCGYVFTDDDPSQAWHELLYRRADTGEIVTLRENREDTTGAPTAAPAGATWDAWWLGDSSRGPDGIALMVRCPNGRDWNVDGRASNCTMPDDKVHKCWVRHGDPRQAAVTVDKNGVTCGAGAGSIQADDYHGFLQAGVLTAG